MPSMRQLALPTKRIRCVSGTCAEGRSHDFSQVAIWSIRGVVTSTELTEQRDELGPSQFKLTTRPSKQETPTGEMEWCSLLSGPHRPSGSVSGTAQSRRQPRRSACPSTIRPSTIDLWDRAREIAPHRLGNFPQKNRKAIAKSVHVRRLVIGGHRGPGCVPIQSAALQLDLVGTLGRRGRDPRKRQRRPRNRKLGAKPRD